MTSHSVLKPQPRPEILAIDPYVPGKSRVPGVARVHKLSSNESPLGPSPRAVEAVRALAFKWIRIVFRCWQDRVAYDENTYLAALVKRGSPLGTTVATGKTL